MKENDHVVFVIKGLGDTSRWQHYLTMKATEWWEEQGLTRVVYTVGWHDREPFEAKLDRFGDIIYKYAATHHKVSLVGMSAGASMALNAKVRFSDVVHRVVNDGGRLRRGKEEGFRSFEARTTTSPAFAQSVTLFELEEPKLNAAQRRNIMTVRSGIIDELVPPSTATLEGATNITIPIPFHSLSNGVALLRGEIVNFLTTGKP